MTTARIAPGRRRSGNHWVSLSFIPLDMITCDLEQHPLTLEELLHLANDDAVRVIRSDGHEFIAAPADTFEEEVARLGNSKRLMRFLEKRSKNRTGRSLEEVERAMNPKADGA